MLKMKKTYLYGGALIALGILEFSKTIDLEPFIAPEYRPLVISVIGAGVLALRKWTAMQAEKNK